MGMIVNPFWYAVGSPPITYSGLTLWIDGTDPSLLYQTSGGSTVSADGQGVQLAQSGGSIARCVFNNGSGLFPLYKSAIVNGKSVLRYDGSNDSSTVTETSSVGTAGSTSTLSNVITNSAYTLICAVNVASARAAQANVFNNDAIFSDSGGFVGLHVSQSGGTLTYHAYNWDGNADSATVTDAAATWVILTVRHDSSNIRIRKNGGSFSSTASGNTTTMTNTPRIGPQFLLNEFLPFDLAHFALYNVALSDADTLSVETYFAGQIGMTL
jgi:hypothetical protein